jgi:hypothetical protein
MCAAVAPPGSEAIIGLAGVVLGAAITAIVQLVTSRQSINAERKRLHERMQGEARLRREELWRTEVRQSLANLLTATDPQAAGSTDRIVQLTHSIDLLLGRDVPEQEQLRRAVIDLSTYVTGAAYSPVLNPVHAHETLGLQNSVYKVARAVLRISDVASP